MNEKKKLEDQHRDLQRKMASYENVIKDQRTYIQATISKKLTDDFNLFVENGGPGGAYDKFIYGDVITNIDTYHT